MSAGSLLATIDGARWFDVPPDVTLPDGALELRGLSGFRRAVDEAAVRPFELDAEAGRDRARQEMVAWLGKAGEGLTALQELLVRQGRDPAALAPLGRIVAGVDDALRRPGDPERPAGPPIDLQARMEAWVRDALEDPQRAERLRRATRDLEAAAERLKARKAPTSDE